MTNNIQWIKAVVSDINLATSQKLLAHTDAPQTHQARSLHRLTGNISNPMQHKHTEHIQLDERTPSVRLHHDNQDLSKWTPALCVSPASARGRVGPTKLIKEKFI